MLSCGGRSWSSSLTQSRDLTGSPEGVSSPGLPRYWCLCLLLTPKSLEAEAGTGSATHEQHSSSLSSHLCQERAPSLAGLLLRIPGAAKHASRPPKATERTGGSGRTKPYGPYTVGQELQDSTSSTKPLLCAGSPAG